MQGKKKFFEHV